MNAQSKDQMVKKLHDMDLQSRLQWQKTSQRDAFQVSIKNYVVTSLAEGDPQDLEFMLRIDNSDGDLVEEIRMSELKCTRDHRRTAGTVNSLPHL